MPWVLRISGTSCRTPQKRMSCCWRHRPSWTGIARSMAAEKTQGGCLNCWILTSSTGGRKTALRRRRSATARIPHSRCVQESRAAMSDGPSSIRSGSDDLWQYEASDIGCPIWLDCLQRYVKKCIAEPAITSERSLTVYPTPGVPSEAEALQYSSDPAHHRPASAQAAG